MDAADPVAVASEFTVVAKGVPEIIDPIVSLANNCSLFWNGLISKFESELIYLTYKVAYSTPRPGLGS